MRLSLPFHLDLSRFVNDLKTMAQVTLANHLRSLTTDPCSGVGLTASCLAAAHPCSASADMKRRANQPTSLRRVKASRLRGSPPSPPAKRLERLRPFGRCSSICLCPADIAFIRCSSSSNGFGARLTARSPAAQAWRGAVRLESPRGARPCRCRHRSAVVRSAASLTGRTHLPA